MFPFGTANIGIFSLTITILLQITSLFITFEPIMSDYNYHKMLSGAKWVFFDLDDTLFDFAACSVVALRELYASSTVLQRRFGDFDAFWEAYHILNSELWRLYHSGSIERDYLKTE